MQRAALILVIGGLCGIGGPWARAGEPAQSTQASAHANVADTAEDKFLREQGYKPELRKGTQYYCRRAAPLGSRFEQTTCLTAEQSRDMRRRSKEMTEHAQRLQSNPSKG